MAGGLMVERLMARHESNRSTSALSPSLTRLLSFTNGQSCSSTYTLTACTHLNSTASFGQQWIDGQRQPGWYLGARQGLRLWWSKMKMMQSLEKRSASVQKTHVMMLSSRLVLDDLNWWMMMWKKCQKRPLSPILPLKLMLFLKLNPFLSHDGEHLDMIQILRIASWR